MDKKLEDQMWKVGVGSSTEALRILKDAVTRLHRFKIFSSSDPLDVEHEMEKFIDNRVKEDPSFLFHEVKYAVDADGWHNAMLIYSVQKNG